MSGRIVAWLNLAARFGAHVLFRLPARAVGARADYRRFLARMRAEGYAPLPPDARARFPEFTRCFHCGACAIAGEPPAGAWDDPWTFVAGPSRSLDQVALVAPHIHGNTVAPAPAAACPAGVPIDFMAATIQRIAARESAL